MSPDLLLTLVVAAPAAALIVALTTRTYRREQARREFSRTCPHTSVRCVHGDEIIALGYARAVCRDCRTLLPDLPGTCSVTGRPHGRAHG